MEDVCDYLNSQPRSVHEPYDQFIKTDTLTLPIHEKTPEKGRRARVIKNQACLLAIS